MRIVVTGGDGFIGQNLRTRLREVGHENVRSVTRNTTAQELRAALASAEFVFHLAGVNRPSDAAEFRVVNTEFTRQVCDLLGTAGRHACVVYASSTQATLDNPYGSSKREGEAIVEQYGATGASIFILRLTNVFGKWARPNYNSAVATFCHNIAGGLPITVNDPSTPMTLLYIDDAVATMIDLLDPARARTGVVDVGPTYSTTLGEVVDTLQSFAQSRRTLLIPRVGTGLSRALYATYLSFLLPPDFAYSLHRHTDPRGAFVEVLKTNDSGQFSYFTAPPGVTRGEHYHHSKTEKFLVVQGKAHFGFRHIVTNETYDVVVEHHAPQIVETVPGWAHNITNIGTSEMIVMLWANETFDPARPDTIAAKVRP